MTDPARERPDRNLAMDLVRATESACLAAARWVGRGDKEAADGAAVEAIGVEAKCRALSDISLDRSRPTGRPPHRRHYVVGRSFWAYRSL